MMVLSLECPEATFFIAFLKTLYTATDLFDNARKLVAHHQRKPVWYDQLDLAAYDHVIERIDCRRHDLDKHLVVRNRGGSEYP